MAFYFHPEAEAELNQAIEYYEQTCPRLGYEFAQEIHATIQRILPFPNAWPQLEQGIRRALVRRFPYGVLYAETKNGIYIIAIMHLHRSPGYWRSRK